MRNNWEKLLNEFILFVFSKTSITIANLLSSGNYVLLVQSARLFNHKADYLLEGTVASDIASKLVPIGHDASTSCDYVCTRDAHRNREQSRLNARIRRCNSTLSFDCESKRERTQSNRRGSALSLRDRRFPSNGTLASCTLIERSPEISPLSQNYRIVRCVRENMPPR